ncbi:YrhB domain-containing protein [Streptomyces sp. NPDC026673]|uniref:YrhB domain-containing protein n=1 Tax=Streptomyces sp. NPDC026673 TaxID=3155724 RepID=UPI0033C55798
MINVERARDIADAYLAQLEADPPAEGVSAVIIRVQEHRFGWEFWYQSSQYAQTGNSRDMWIGTGPVVVDRRDGRLQELGGRQFGDTVAQYQRLYDQETSTSTPSGKNAGSEDRA